MIVRFARPVTDSMFRLHNRLPMWENLWSDHRTFTPAVDVAEGENSYELVMELPGMSKEDVRISVEENVLTISGERVQKDLPEGTKVIHRETTTQAFKRAFQLPEDVDRQAIEAELKNGILRLRLPKTEHARPREISVK